MTTTYDITTLIGKVRLITGDKTIATAVFTDEEIEVFLTNQSNDVNLASADLLEAWASSYAAAPDSEKIGDYSYTQKIVDKMLGLAKRLRETSDSAPYMTWAEPDLTCGSGITTEED